MLLRLAKCLILISLMLSVGLHWVFLQSIAWAGMFAKYSQTAPLTEAIAMTFDGKHPCRVCKVVREGQESEGKHEFKNSSVKIDFWVISHLPLLYPPDLVLSFSPTHPESSQNISVPLKPPPRLA